FIRSLLLARSLTFYLSVHMYPWKMLLKVYLIVCSFQAACSKNFRRYYFAFTAAARSLLVHMGTDTGYDRFEWLRRVLEIRPDAAQLYVPFFPAYHTWEMMKSLTPLGRAIAYVGSGQVHGGERIDWAGKPDCLDDAIGYDEDEDNEGWRRKTMFVTESDNFLERVITTCPELRYLVIPVETPEQVVQPIAILRRVLSLRCPDANKICTIILCDDRRAILADYATAVQSALI
ncbi:hypothetical protein PMAYCL1PPCAC_20985, partial [Pristionchus mayeri]